MFDSDTLYPPRKPTPVQDAVWLVIIVALVVAIFAIIAWRIAHS